MARTERKYLETAAPEGEWVHKPSSGLVWPGKSIPNEMRRRRCVTLKWEASLAERPCGRRGERRREAVAEEAGAIVRVPFTLAT